MFNQNRPILYLPQPWDAAVPFFVERLRHSGLQVLRTFDLHETRAEGAACTCPNPSTDACDCQMVVLLVYGSENPPASLIAHGHHGQTWFSLVECLGELNTHLEEQIRAIFLPSQEGPTL